MNSPSAPLGILDDQRDREWAWERSSNHYGGYALELLAHAGVPHVALGRDSLASPEGLPRIVLLPYPIRLAPAEEAGLGAHVRSGGSVIACGGVEGGDSLFGVRGSRRYLDEARLLWPQGGLGLVGGELPVWGAQVVRPLEGEDAELLGEIRGEDGESGAALAIRKLENGFTCYLSLDVPRSVVTIQQGRPVLGDGKPASDGSAAIDDRILKSDDGAVIDWILRQESPEGPVFATPYADRLRELLLATILTCAERMRLPLPMLWYWPDALPAVATLSFDTDSNEGADGWAFLDVLERLGVTGTWCVMYPGGYPRELYDAIRARGDEIALHFDGLTSDLKPAPYCSWQEEDFRHQFDWLLRETRAESVTSQKNHVTRWEGWVELFRWVERSGIAVDQTKGPSKIGNMGFTFGTCHPWRPVEDLRHDNRLMDLLELPYITHDMHHSERRLGLRRLLLDRVIEHSGAAHFVFHPQRIHEEGMAAALGDIVEYARERNVPWWTSERIADWERSRRESQIRRSTNERGETMFEFRNVPEGATLLLFGVPEDVSVAGGAKASVERDEVLGRSALRLILPAGDSQICLAKGVGANTG